VDSLVLASQTGVRLELVPTSRPYADNEATPAWDARLIGRGLSASRTCAEAGWQPQSLWRFLAELATDWRGWDGDRTWQSEEGELRLTAVHNKTNTVTVTAELEDGAPPRWKLTAELQLDPGVLQTLAAEAKRLSELRPT
jgi:hypothetical protein